MIHVTHHAADRWVERVSPQLSRDQAAAEIRDHTPAIVKAAEFGCTIVRLGNGARLILEGRKVITVYGRDMRRLQSFHYDNHFQGA